MRKVIRFVDCAGKEWDSEEDARRAEYEYDLAAVVEASDYTTLALVMVYDEQGRHKVRNITRGFEERLVLLGIIEYAGKLSW